MAKVKSRKRAVLPGPGASTIAEWDEDGDWIILALYPEVMANHGTGSAWVKERLLPSTLKEFSLFYDSATASQVQVGLGLGIGLGIVDQDNAAAAPPTVVAPDSTVFDPAFQALLRRSEALGRKAAMELGDAQGDYADADADADAEDGSNESAKRKQTATKKKGKEQRVWHDGNAKVTKSALAQLNRSKDTGAGNIDSIEAAVAEDSRALAEARAAYLPEDGEMPLWEEEEELVDEDDPDSSSEGGWGSSLKGIFEQMSGNKVLTARDLEAPLVEMQRMLTSKNVASDIATQICDGIRDKLVGKRLQSFSRVKTAVRQALEAAIAKLLKPAHNREVDVLRSVVTKRERGTGGLFTKAQPVRPYVIVMVGINGVGKSTSLAKIAYYLKCNGCNPLIAACDTFRSGAVEQLNVHANCLDVPLYHKGYAKDPSAVAKSAIAHATQEGHDVVLVDTAGRMQNNVPLMKALSKLVVENQPDLVLFVCEALVGNDGMDQLQMFEKALISGGHKRQIDGVVLTKFDTVSDKVGAALTLTQLSGAPVIFVGTGQKYNHLKKLSVPSVIQSLFS
eukprot:scaffold93242_cov48-Attheya_sp.AAC.2